MNLNARRIAALLQLEYHELRGRVLICFMAVLPLAAAFAWLAAVKYSAPDIHSVIFNGLFMLSGAVVSAGCFYEFTTPARKGEYLSLPAYSLEKLISKFLLVVPLYLLTLFAGYFIIALIINTGLATFGITVDPFDPFTADTFALVTVFLAVQGVFVLGSVVFDRHALLRTFAVIDVIAIAGALLVYLTLRVAYPEYFSGWRLIEKIDFDTANNFFTGELLPFLAHAAFFYLLPVAAWTAAGIALKKKVL